MDGIGRIVRTVAAIVLVVMMLITFFDVVGRQLIGRPLEGATELTEICLMLITFLMFPFVALRGAHIKVDLLEVHFGRLARLGQRLLTNLLGAAIFGLLAYRMWIVAGRSIGYGDITPELEIPVGYLFWTMAALSAATSLAFLVAAFLRARASDDDDASPEALS